MTKENKREQILNALDELLPGKRFHEITLDEVARVAGVGKGTIYLYFHDKEELFAELVCYHLENLQQELTKLAATEEPDWPVKIFDLVTGFIRKHHSGAGAIGNLVSCMAKLTGEQYEKLKTHGSAVIDTVAEVIVKNQPEWSFSEARTYAQMFLWMIDGYAKADLSGAVTPGRANLVDFFCRGAGVVQQNKISDCQK